MTSKQVTSPPRRITTMERLKARPPAQKIRFGHRTASSPCPHSIGKFFLWSSFFSLKLLPPARPGTTCMHSFIHLFFGYSYVRICINSIYLYPYVCSSIHMHPFALDVCICIHIYSYVFCIHMYSYLFVCTSMHSHGFICTHIYSYVFISLRRCRRLFLGCAALLLPAPHQSQHQRRHQHQ